MGIIKDIQDSLASIPVNPVLRERLQLLIDQNKTLEDCKKSLEEEKANMLATIHDLTCQLEKRRVLEEYVKYKGAAFKRLPGGGYAAKSIFCPVCQRPASGGPGGRVFCSPCKWFWPLKADSIHTCISELEILDREKENQG